MADEIARAGHHNCRHRKQGTRTCWIHQFTGTTLQTQFGRLMIEIFPVDERRRLHEISSRAMLPPDGRAPLDAMPADVVNRELDQAAAIMRYRDTK